MSEQITLEQFIEKHGLISTAHRVANRPDGLMAGDNQRHFRFQIIKQGTKPQKHMGLYFSQGSAHTESPTLADVLDCLASDASGYENAKSGTYGKPFATPFLEWAGEYGYDTDSRAAEKSYKTVKRQAEQLKRVLGSEAYEELLYNTERL